MHLCPGSVRWAKARGKHMRFYPDQARLGVRVMWVGGSGNAGNRKTFLAPSSSGQDPETFLAHPMKLTGNLERNESYAALHELQRRNATELITGLRLPFNALPPQAIHQVYSSKSSLPSSCFAHS